MALVDYVDSGDEISDVEVDDMSKPNLNSPNLQNEMQLQKDKVEPEIKMRVPKSAKIPGLTLNIPFEKTKSGKVLFSIPDYENLDSSDDDDTIKSQLSNTNYKLHSGRSQKVDLLSLLPPTKSSAIRENNKLLIPHQLARRNVAAAPNDVTLKPVNNNHNLESTDIFSDSIEWKEDIAVEAETLTMDDEPSTIDDEPSTFFSFYTPEPCDVEAVASLRAATSRACNPDNVRHPSFTFSTGDLNSVLNERNVTQIHELTPKISIVDAEVLSQSRSCRNDDPDETVVEDEICWNEETFVPGPERKRARLRMPGTMSSSSLPVHELLSSTQTEIKSVNQSDLTAGAQLELIKSVTSDDSQYKRPKPDDDPGKLAHRKHQITWLAYQAQENEMDLEKRWAEARRNKASNRAKYGF